MNKTILLSAIALLASSYTFASNHTHVMEGDNSMKMHHQSKASIHNVISATPTHTIKVTASDSMSFTPKSWSFKKGQIVRFVVTNKGSLNHEFSIGNHAEMLEHDEMMKAMPNMQHEQGNAISLKPGETKDLTWSFTDTGIFEAACNIPGHYESGMKSTITVTEK